MSSSSIRRTHIPLDEYMGVRAEEGTAQQEKIQVMSRPPQAPPRSLPRLEDERNASNAVQPLQQATPPPQPSTTAVKQAAPPPVTTAARTAPLEEPTPKEYLPPLARFVPEPLGKDPTLRAFPQDTKGKLKRLGYYEAGSSRYYVYEDESGQRFVLVPGTGSKEWYKYEDFEKALEKTKDFLKTANYIEYSAFPSGNVERLVRENSGWLRVTDSGPVPLSEKEYRELFSSVLAKNLGRTTAVQIAGFAVNEPHPFFLAREEPEMFAAYGYEAAKSQKELKKVFPELQGEKWIVEVDVWRAVTGRLERMGYKFDTDENYRAAKMLTEAVMKDPSIWRRVEEEYEKQRALLGKQQINRERLERAEQILQNENTQQKTDKYEELTKSFEEFYRVTAGEHHPLNVFLGALGATFARSFFVPAPVQGYEVLLARRAELASKVPAPGMLTSEARIDIGKRLGVFSKEELAELKAMEKYTDTGKELAYLGGYLTGFGMAGKVWGEITSFVGYEVGKILPSSVKTRLAGVAEKLGLVEKKQLVPEEVEVVGVRAGKGLEYDATVKTEIKKWVSAEEALGRKLLPEEKLQPGEVSWLPLEGGKKAPVVEGKISVARSLPEGYVEIRGTGEGGASTLSIYQFLEKPVERARLFYPARVDYVAYGGKVNYEQARVFMQGGLPKQTLQEIPRVALAPSPRIPVMEVVTKGPTVNTAVMALPPLAASTQRAKTSIQVPVQLQVENKKIEEHQPPPPSMKIPVIEKAEEKGGPAPYVPFMPPLPPVITAVRPYPTVTFPAPRQGKTDISVDTTRSPVLPRLSAPGIKLSNVDIVPVKPPTPRAKTEMPLPPPLGIGRRDLPVFEQRLPKMKKEWTVKWFSVPLSPLEAQKKTARRGSRGKRKR